MSDDDTREFDPLHETARGRRVTGRFGWAEPAQFDPQPPPLPIEPPPPPPPRRRRSAPGTLRRLLALLLVVGALLVAVVLEGPTRRPSGAVATTTTGPPPVAIQVGIGPEAPRAFYCPEGSTVEGVEHYLVLVNTSPAALTARLSFLVSGATPSPIPVPVPPGGRELVRVNDHVEAFGVGTLVEADGPGLAVEEVLFFDEGQRRGTLVASCTAQVASDWFFPGGTTARGYELWLLLINPFPEDAVVDVVSVADGETVRPPDLQQVPVQARSRVSLPLHERILRRDRVATRVTATRGRVAAAQSTFLLEEPKGASLMVGATAPAPVWYFGEGFTEPGVTATVSVYNPGEEEASLQVDLLVSEGEPPTPQRMRVPAGGRNDLVVGADLVPATSFGIRVISSTPVVVSRSQLAGPPSDRRGYLFTLGVVAPHRAWIVPETSAERPFDAYLSVVNPGSAAARVRVGSLAGGVLSIPENLREVALPAGRRLTLHLPEYFSGLGLTMVVLSDQPVVVESAIYLTSPRYGSTASPGVPVEGAVVFNVVAVPAKPPPTTTTTTTTTTQPPMTETVPPDVAPGGDGGEGEEVGGDDVGLEG